MSHPIYTAFQQADWAKTFRLIEEHIQYGANQPEGYPTVKNAIRNQLFQGLQPTEANKEALKMLIEELLTPKQPKPSPFIFNPYQPIKDLVARARLDEALKTLLENVPDHLKNDVRSLQTRLTENDRNDRLGLADYREVGTERAKITTAILSLCDMAVEDSLNTRPDIPGEGNSKATTGLPFGQKPKKILFISATPGDLDRLTTDKEFQRLKAQYERGRKREQFEFLPVQLAVTIQELLRAMNDQPQVVHFSGHGEETGICITDSSNNSIELPAHVLEMLFRPHAGTLELVILNCCFSAKQAEAIAALGIPVIGNSLKVADKAAVSFSEGFYIGLGEGKSYREAFNHAQIVLAVEHPYSSNQIVYIEPAK